MPKERVVTAKKRCCKDAPRCKKCPVVCKRLLLAGLAEKVGDRQYVVSAPKKAVAAARARG